jgi:hypothetical protein
MPRVATFEAWIALATASVLLSCSPDEPHIRDVDSGVDTRIDAVISLPARDLESFFVASGGVVVDEQGGRWELSTYALHNFVSEQNERIWVVGDHGYIAYTDVEVDEEPVPTEWIPTSTGTQADLYDLAPVEAQVVAVGDEMVLVGIEQEDSTYEWSQPQAPADGWGMLRGITWIYEPGSDVPRYLAVGLAGRALVSTSGGDSWSVVPLSTDVDFHFICGELAIGAGFTRANWTGETWDVHVGTSSAEPIGLSCGGIYFDTYVVSSDRWLSRLSDGELERVLRLDWQPRAFDPLGLYLAGDHGRLAYWFPDTPAEG